MSAIATTSGHRAPSRGGSVEIPRRGDAEIRVGHVKVKLTNLEKVFWPKEKIIKADLLQYYADVAPFLLPHLRQRAMVMKRYPNGAEGEFFFMKRAPAQKPSWVKVCSIEHASGSVIAFPVVNDLPSLLWIVNLGCIDMNPWYARCDDVQRPDYLHFDLDPVKGAEFETVREAALIVRDALRALGMEPLAKTSGSRGIHIYVPIRRGPTQKEVWSVAKGIAQVLAQRHPKLLTSEYTIAKRPKGRVLIDYNQNAWGRTLASIYSVRPKPEAPISTPVTFEEIERGFEIADFNLRTIRARLSRVGDLWKPLLATRGRFNLARYI